MNEQLNVITLPLAPDALSPARGLTQMTSGGVL